MKRVKLTGLLLAVAVAVLAVAAGNGALTVKPATSSLVSASSPCRPGRGGRRAGRGIVGHALVGLRTVSSSLGLRRPARTSGKMWRIVPGPVRTRAVHDAGSVYQNSAHTSESRRTA